MKQIIKMAAMAAFAVLLFACGSSNTPSGTAEKALKCLQDKDFDGYVDLIYSNGDEVRKDEDKQGMVALLKEKYEKAVEENGGIKDYKILSEKISEDGNTAVVEYSITIGDEEKNEKMNMRKDEDGNWKIDFSK